MKNLSQTTRKARGCTNAFIVFVVITLIVGTLLYFAPAYLSRPGKSRESEAKSSLHRIQLQVERYAVDHEGEYPPYLIGGEARCAEVVDMFRDDIENGFKQIREVPIEQVSDPLIRTGYIRHYPANPFMKQPAIGLHQYQTNLPPSRTGDDPLRNACETGQQFGTRFGAQCDLMGNIMADPRFTERRVTATDDPKTINVPTYADIDFEFWDAWWSSRNPHMYVQGACIYKSHGDFIDFQPSCDDVSTDSMDLHFDIPYRPEHLTNYILGAVGDRKTKGLDVLGEEQPVVCMLPDPHEPGRMTEHPLWLWTRDQVSDDPTDREGSPFGVIQSGQGKGEVTWGNPNGIYDAIILVLTNGEDYVGREYIRDYGDMENATLNTAADED